MIDRGKFDKFSRIVLAEKPNDPTSFLISYAREFVDQDLASEVMAENRTRPLDMSLLSADSDLQSLTKRVTLVSDRILISHEGIGESVVLPFNEKPARDGSWHQKSDSVQLRCPSPDQLGRYLQDCWPMIESGRLLYYPDVLKTQTYVDESDDGDYWYGFGGDRPSRTDVSHTARHLFDFAVKGRHLVELTRDSGVRGDILRPLLQIEIPYIEGTSLRDFSRIAVEESEALNALQGSLRSELLSIDTRGDERTALVEAHRLEARLATNVRQLTSEWNRVRRRNAVQAAGAGLATFAATLVAVGGAEFAAIAAVLGTTGGIWGFFTATNQYLDERSKLRERDVYFLWLLSQRARKA